MMQPAWVTDWKWFCLACGTLTNDGDCDCTLYGNPADRRTQNLVLTASIDWPPPEPERGK